MAWLDGSRVGKAQLLSPINDGSRPSVSLPPLPGARNLAGVLEPDGSFGVFAQNGYSRNELVYACISLRAESLPQASLRVYPAGMSNEPIEDHRLRRLIENPNPLTTEFELFELLVTYLDLAGNAYLLVERGRDGLPARLWPLRPDMVGVIPSAADPNVFAWVYRPDVQRPEIQVVIPRSDMIQVKYPNPSANPQDRYFGKPPLRSAARAVSMDNAATDFVDTLLRNDATPTTVVTVQDEITEELVERLRSKWFSRYSGARRGSPAFLQAGMDVKVLGINLKDLEFPDLRASSETHICMAFKVPPILVNAKVGLDRSTFANYQEAVRSFWFGPLQALHRRFRDAFAKSLLPEFSGVGRRSVMLSWDISNVPALREAESARWERATNALARGGITQNDFRLTVGLPPVPGGDRFLIPAGVTLTEAGVPGEAQTVAASLMLTAAEFGVELTPEETRALEKAHG